MKHFVHTHCMYLIENKVKLFCLIHMYVVLYLSI